MHSFSLLAGLSAGETENKLYRRPHCWVLRETRECFRASLGSNDKWPLQSYRKKLFVRVVFVGCLREVVVCVLFENCTVDASIFVVSNEERTVDALAPGADEGRRRLR